MQGQPPQPRTDDGPPVSGWGSASGAGEPGRLAVSSGDR
jgi:hypothetical protein